jgi:hypothetical protein
MTEVNLPGELNLEIAGLTVTITSQQANILPLLEKKFASFKISREKEIPNFQLEIQMDNAEFFHPVNIGSQYLLTPRRELIINTPSIYALFSLSSWNGLISLNSRATANEIEYALRLLYSFIIFESGGLLVHASGLVINHKGYLFVGKSGAGKSTIVRHSVGIPVLGDDMIAVIPETHGWSARSTPFTNPDLLEIKPCSVELLKIYFLRKSTFTSTGNLSKSEAVAEMVSNIPVVPLVPEFSSDVVKRCQELISCVTFKKLMFLPDASYLEII